MFVSRLVLAIELIYTSSYFPERKTVHCYDGAYTYSNDNALYRIVSVDFCPLALFLFKYSRHDRIQCLYFTTLKTTTKVTIVNCYHQSYILNKIWHSVDCRVSVYCDIIVLLFRCDNIIFQRWANNNNIIILLLLQCTPHLSPISSRTISSTRSHRG